MKKLPLLILLALTSCASYQKQMSCQSFAGPEPNIWANSFGLVGALANASSDEHRVWAHRVDVCLAEK